MDSTIQNGSKITVNRRGIVCLLRQILLLTESMLGLNCTCLFARGADYVGPIVNPENNHQYYLVPPNSWLGAELQARQLGGHLVVVDDAGENNWLRMTFAPFAQVAWIGLHDGQTEGIFHTTDGRRPSYFRSPVNGALNSAEADFVELNLNTSEWRLQNALTARHGIVEVAPLPSVIWGPLVNSTTGSTYYLLSDSSWSKAQAKALELGGNLVTVSSREENDWLLSTFGRWEGVSDVWLWIGLTDKNTEGRFHWISGQPVEFTNWSSGQPDNAGGKEHYVQMYSSGRWNDLTDTPPFELSVLWLGVVEVEPLLLQTRVSQIEMRWNSTIGRRYQIEQKNTASGGWSAWGIPFVGTGAQISTNVNVPPGSSSAMFRISVLD